VSYTLGEAEYAAAESGEGWAAHMLVAFEAAVTWLQPLLTSANYEVSHRLCWCDRETDEQSYRDRFLSIC
jgi:hypothetical protein